MRNNCFASQLAGLARQQTADMQDFSIRVLTTPPRSVPPLTTEEKAILTEARRLLKLPAGHWEPYGPEDDPWEFNVGGRWGKWVAHPYTVDEEAIIERAMAINQERDRLMWGED